MRGSGAVGETPRDVDDDLRMVKLFDTTLRDGEQAPGFGLEPAQKLRFARQQVALGVDVIEAGFAASSPAEAEAISAIARDVGRDCVIASMARASTVDVDVAAAALSITPDFRIHTFVPVSDLHIDCKLGSSRAAVLDASGGRDPARPRAHRRRAARARGRDPSRPTVPDRRRPRGGAGRSDDRHGRRHRRLHRPRRDDGVGRGAVHRRGHGRGHAVGPLPRRPRPGRGELARRPRRRCRPGRVHRQRHRRACRQRVARRDRHVAAHTPAGPRARHHRPHAGAHRLVAVAGGTDGHRRAAQQGDRRGRTRSPTRRASTSRVSSPTR